MGLLQPTCTPVPRDGDGAAPHPSSPHHPHSHEHVLFPRQTLSAPGCWLLLCHLLHALIEELSSAWCVLPAKVLSHCNQVGASSLLISQTDSAGLRSRVVPGLMGLPEHPAGVQHPVAMLRSTPWRCPGAGDAAPTPSVQWRGVSWVLEGSLPAQVALWDGQGRFPGLLAW